MTVSTDIQKDIRSLIVASLPTLPVYDRWAQPSDSNPYITFGYTQRVRNHAKETRYSIYYVMLHLWVRDTQGSVEARNLSESIIDALDMQKLATAQLDCYFTDSMQTDDTDESMQHIVMSFEIR